MRNLVVAAISAPVIIDNVRDPLTEHLARVLVLIDAFSGPKAALRGLDKLARLDFLLRYPAILQAALNLRGKPMPNELRPARYERLSSQSLNAAWQFGPWDHRYLPLIGWLVGTTQATASSTINGLELRSTVRGRELVEVMDGPWSVTKGRAGLLRRHLNLSADNLRAAVAPLLDAASEVTQ